MFQSVFYAHLLCILCLLSSPLFSETTTPQKRQALLHSLDPLSLPQHLSFYRLYPHTEEGLQAYHTIHSLLNGSLAHPEHLPTHALFLMLELISNPDSTALPTLNSELLASIQRLSLPLAHHRLKGHLATSEAALLNLPSEEIDIARAILLLQGNLNLQQIASYEALIDLIALQILPRLPEHSSKQERVEAITRFLFKEMAFHFPPLSQFEKEIERFTFLDSVLDSRQGVCLGVSILYLALAQRLNLSLEIVTPPGHIYLSSPPINIETTAQGIHVEDEFYLTLNTPILQKRSLKEVLALALYNRASLSWEKQDFAQCHRLYKQAELYLQQDQHLQELLAFSAILSGMEEEGQALLRSLDKQPSRYLITKEPLAAEYLSGKIDKEGLKILLTPCEDKPADLRKKEHELALLSARFPECSSLFSQRAALFLKLKRPKEALQMLEQAHRLSLTHPQTEYMLAQLYSADFNFPKAWEHLNECALLTKAHNHTPKVLTQLQRQLTVLCPTASLSNRNFRLE